MSSFFLEGPETIPATAKVPGLRMNPGFNLGSSKMDGCVLAGELKKDVRADIRKAGAKKKREGIPLAREPGEKDFRDFFGSFPRPGLSYSPPGPWDH